MQHLTKQTIDTILKDNYGGDTEAFMREVSEYLQQVRVTSLRTKASKKSFVNAPAIVELFDVERTYSLGRKNKVKAVDGVNMTIHEGEIVALTGPSGSGKSTLMHLIGGLDQPTGGDIVVGGKSLKKMSDRKLAKYRTAMVGFVFQFFYLQPFLKVKRNVEVPLMFARAKRKDRAQTINQVVEAVSLGDRADHLPKELSGGQMQRVAIARALVNQPKILLADEPTGNLDSKTSESIMQLLQRIRDEYGTTMVIVTHDPRIAAWADRVIRLEDGKVVA